MSDLGSGLSLDEQWDLYVDESSGDLAFDSADREVRKDLAFILGRALNGEGSENSGVVGRVIDEGRAGDLRLRIRKLILSDERIDTVENIEVNPDIDGSELEIEIEATTVTGVQIEDVFTLS